ncbi:putative ion transport protein [Botrytis fragariae]|uniref:Putative ion transport protein n=1 Tax=Botrytis fragariae TaxID=1964551 RepID=A0A8H6ALB4_9HELO|nr:putative ion transport protein [Botrytis fragariae]KAF5869479.1 putative ion transport protein [Botrytis fragariae]
MSRRNSDISEHAPLIRASSQPISIASGPSYHHVPHPSFLRKLSNSYRRSQTSAKSFLSSRAQHYTVLLLVACDLISIISDIIINLYQCDNDKEGKTDPIWNEVRDGLGIAGLIFSCLFMVELIASIWAFGLSKFHCFDATVIVAGFVVDVLLHGVLEEVASLVIILRLWRFFKIVEEFSVGAQEQMDGLEERIEQLEMENRELKNSLEREKMVSRIWRMERVA